MITWSSRLGDNDIIFLEPLTHTGPEPRMRDHFSTGVCFFGLYIVRELRWLGLGAFGAVLELLEVDGVDEFAQEELHLDIWIYRVSNLQEGHGSD